MRFLYILAAYALAPFYCAVLLWRGFGERGYWRNLGERFGYGATLGGRSIWVHAVSVGEVQAAAALIRSLRERYSDIPLVITSATAAGRERAAALFGGIAQVRHIPLDLPGPVRRFFDRLEPRLAIILETELWPNLYHECRQRCVPLILASARISPRSIGRYRRMAALFRHALASDIVVAAQSEGDAERFRSIGVDAARTHVTGNIKFDITIAPQVLERGKALRQLHAAGRPVWVAGSTHEVEEQIVLDAHRRMRSSALLILVPRHPNRFAEVAEWLARERVAFVRRSQGIACEPGTDVLLVDSVGELLDFYAAADVAFVGGSLVPIGGHNLLEPAVLALPILTGPHHFNGEDIARLLIERGAARIVRDAAALASDVEQLLSSPVERTRMGSSARAAVEESRGALGRLLALIDPLVMNCGRAAQGAGAAGGGSAAASH